MQYRVYDIHYFANFLIDRSFHESLVHNVYSTFFYHRALEYFTLID